MTFEMRNKLPDDHPIKRGMVAFVPRRIETAEPNSMPEIPADQSPDPMQGAIDQIERALRAKDARHMTERSNDTTDSD